MLTSPQTFTGGAMRPCSRLAVPRNTFAATGRPAWTPARRGLVCQAAETEKKGKSAAEMTIDDLDTAYCNDFVCESSPAVELVVRQFAKDIQRQKYTMSSFQPDVEYSDGFRSFKGTEKYRRAFWPREGLQNPRVTLTKMRMLEKDVAQIDWQLAGQVAVFNVVIPMTTEIKLNQLTGRVEKHKESWDLSKLAPQAAAACTASRVAWSAKQASQDAQEGLGKAAESLSSLASFDEDQYTNMNPNDPTRFFQQNNNNNDDILTLGLGVALLYLVYKAYAVLNGL